MSIKPNSYTSIGQALLAAFLFGLSAPVSKVFLKEIHPVVLSSFFYLGTGFGLLLYKIVSRFFKSGSKEAGIAISDLGWLFGAIVAGGITAPIILMFSLKASPASTASLLLNFESVSTSLIAYLVFKESVGKKVWYAIILITFASSLLVFETAGEWGVSFGSLGVLTACVLWGLDNNFTRNISAKDPVTIVMTKGLAAGSVTLLIAGFSGMVFPGLNYSVAAMITGFFCYGLSIMLFIRSLRNLGASRTGAYFSIAPFLGVIFSFVIFHEAPDILFFVSLPFMILGVILLSSEKHLHEHLHEEIIHEHQHRHDDGHHNHIHDEPGFTPSLAHSHVHKHEKIMHAHKHAPDIHHRHSH